jgi:hypothetical protein
MDDETAKKLVGLAGLGLGLTSGSRANYGMDNAPASTYQGGIPEYDFVREQVLDTYEGNDIFQTLVSYLQVVLVLLM